jgi:hypothetical protein
MHRTTKQLRWDPVSAVSPFVNQRKNHIHHHTMIAPRERNIWEWCIRHLNFLFLPIFSTLQNYSFLFSFLLFFKECKGETQHTLVGAAILTAQVYWRWSNPEAENRLEMRGGLQTTPHSQRTHYMVHGHTSHCSLLTMYQWILKLNGS